MKLVREVRAEFIKIKSNSMTAKEKLLQSLLEAFAEFAREEHNSRIRRGIAFAKQQKRK